MTEKINPITFSDEIAEKNEQIVVLNLGNHLK